MKAFLEEYGLVIVVIIVVAVLISLAVYFSGSGRDKITETYDSFTAGAQSLVDKAMSETGTNGGAQTGGSNG